MTWAELQAGWDAVANAVSETWQSAYAAAESAWASVVTEEPERTAAQVAAFQAELEATRANLDAMAAKLPQPAVSVEDQALHARYEALEARYHELAAGFYTDVQPAKAPALGVIPIIVVGALAVGLGAASWSFAAYEYAVNLREQTALANKELDARIEASKEGRTLQETTLPPPSDGGIDAKIALGGAALALGLILLPVLLKR